MQENQQNIDLLEVICWIETLTLAGDGGGSTRHNEEAKSRRNYPVYVVFSPRACRVWIATSLAATRNDEERCIPGRN